MKLDPVAIVDPPLRPGIAGQLTIVEGRATGRKFKVADSAIVGRSPDATVMLDDAEVSRLHARISRDAGGAFQIEDLGSKNGTLINGVRVERRLLVYGDKIRLGPHVVLEFNGFDAVEDHIIQRQRFEAIGRLGVGIAHDLNNVLAALDAGASYLRELPVTRSLGDAEVRECISDLGLAACRATELTRSILSFAGERGSERAAVDLATLVREVVRMLRHTMDHAIRIESAVEANLLVHGSQSELHQVLLNLCLNARDAMPEGGVLRITASKVMNAPRNEFPKGLAASLSVADTGVGMDTETQRRIFDPFFTTKRGGAGYGLGLGTVREIVSLHGGQVGLESAVDRGSRFTIFLPLLEPGERFSNTEERSPPPNVTLDRGRVSILLVDDEQIVRRSVARLLRQAGFEVTEAGGGAEAIALYAQRAHDLVLLDLDMPGLNGEQTQVRLIGLDPLARIVFATGHADPQREAAVRARGALAFLQKPYGLDVLVAIVNQAMTVELCMDTEELTRPR